MIRYLSDLSEQAADTLIIMLPGANHQPEGFIEEGFVSAVRERRLPVDLMMAELPFSHIADTTAVYALHHDIVQPAKAKGYRKVWIAGISIGGYLAIAYANRYPAQLDGISLIAPYPGNRITTGEIAVAGGVHHWLPGTIAEDDTERHNWLWLKLNHATGPTLYLGYGKEDRFVAGHKMMAALLPERQVDVVPGEHVWPVWLQLWHRFLDKEFGVTHV